MLKRRKETVGAVEDVRGKSLNAAAAHTHTQREAAAAAAFRER